MSDQTSDARRRDLGQLIRFAIVGSFNTLLDFALLFLFVYAFHLDKYVANVLSTGICLVVSFFLNKKWTFKAGGSHRRQFIAFLIVTLLGLWVVQTMLIWGGTALLNPWLQGPLLLLIAKLIATVGSLTWNYVLYAKFVFKG